MKLGSLFDGIGGFPYSAQRHDIEPLWASEIEPAPVNITKKQFPSMEHIGDVTKINGAEINPADIITFGSPCQDLSIAGKQAGLDGERSGLFMEAVRIIKEMREATNGRYPTYAVWENVPGAFSSHKCEDFRRVLEALSESEIPMPRSGKWAESGMVRVSDREISWRTFDAQYWGVPQRRKRIYLVCHFGTERTEEILFECESLLGYTPQSGEEREEAAASVGSCAESAGRAGRVIPYTLKIRSGCEGGGKGALIQNDKSATLATNNDQYLFQPIPDELSGTFDMTHANEVIRHNPEDLSPTLQSRMGTGGNQVPLVVDTAYCIAGNIVDRSDTAGANGVGVKEDCSYTLNTVDRHAIAYCIGNGQADQTKLHDIAGALNCMHDQQAVIYAIDRAAFNQGENAKYDFEVSDKGTASTPVARGPSAVCYDIGEERRRTPSEYAELSPTITARCGTGGNNTPAVVHKIAHFFRWIVRRLTPRECERLQGFPDDWTRYGADGKEIKDAPRYKALGNSIAIPCADRVFKGIIEFERKKHEQNSRDIPPR